MAGMMYLADSIDSNLEKVLQGYGLMPIMISTHPAKAVKAMQHDPPELLLIIDNTINPNSQKRFLDKIQNVLPDNNLPIVFLYRGNKRKRLQLLIQKYTFRIYLKQFNNTLELTRMLQQLAQKAKPVGESKSRDLAGKLNDASNRFKFLKNPTRLKRVFCYELLKLLAAEGVIIGLKKNKAASILFFTLQQKSGTTLKDKSGFFSKLVPTESLLNDNTKISTKDLNLPKNVPLRSLIILPLPSDRGAGFVIIINKKSRLFKQEDLNIAKLLTDKFLLINDQIASSNQLERISSFYKRKEQQHKYIQKQLEIQYEIEKILAETSNIIAATPLIVQTICQALKFDLGNLWIADNNVLRCTSTWSRNSKDSKSFEKKFQGLTVSKRDLNPQKILRQNDDYYLVHVCDYDSIRRYDDSIECRFQSVISFPLILNNQILAIMECWSKRPIECTYEINFIAKAVCEQVENFIKNKRVEKELLYLVEHDPLTKLANRRLLLHSLKDLLKEAKQKHSKVALFFMDLDNFKQINDTYGHLVGDKLLQEVATRIKKKVRGQDLIARLGGDEFVVVINSDDENFSATDYSQKLLDIFKDEFRIRRKQFHISTSIGISLFPQDGDNEISLLEKSDFAMYRAKEKGGNKYQLYLQNIEHITHSKNNLTRKLRTAIKQKTQLRLFYQPTISLMTNQIIALEALPCWNLPSGKTIYPQELLTLAESAGVHLKIVEWALTHVCEHLTILKTSRSAIPVTLGIHSQDCLTKEFHNKLFQLLTSNQVESELFHLEVPEKVLVKKLKHNQLSHLSTQNIGIHIAVDQSGINFNTMRLLHSLAVHAIKIDACLLEKITESKQDLAIIKAVIILAHELGIKVIAQGITNKQQLSILKQHKCDYAQVVTMSAKSFDELQVVLKNNWNIAA